VPRRLRCLVTLKLVHGSVVLRYQQTGASRDGRDGDGKTKRTFRLRSTSSRHRPGRQQAERRWGAHLGCDGPRSGGRGMAARTMASSRSAGSNGPSRAASSSSHGLAAATRPPGICTCRPPAQSASLRIKSLVAAASSLCRSGGPASFSGRNLAARSATGRRARRMGRLKKFNSISCRVTNATWAGPNARRAVGELCLLTRVNDTHQSSRPLLLRQCFVIDIRYRVS
jgi:hypothetical protein